MNNFLYLSLFLTVFFSAHASDDMVESRYSPKAHKVYFPTSDVMNQYISSMSSTEHHQSRDLKPSFIYEGIRWSVSFNDLHNLHPLWHERKVEKNKIQEVSFVKNPYLWCWFEQKDGEDTYFLPITPVADLIGFEAIMAKSGRYDYFFRSQDENILYYDVPLKNSLR